MKRIARFLIPSLSDKSLREGDLRRRERVLNAIVTGSIILFSLFTILVLYNYLTVDDYGGISLIFALVILGIFAFIYFLSKIGRITLAAYLLVFIYFIFTTYGIFIWGINLPQCLLTYAILIVIAGIVLGKACSVRLTIVIALTMIVVGYLQINELIGIEDDWKQEMFTMNDAIEYSITLGIITLVSWLSNSEIEKSLDRARKSEAELKLERDMLEEKVRERTEELKRIQYEKNRQVFKMAEFGKLSSGLFHDLSNYLAVLFLSVEGVERGKDANFSKTKDDIERVNLSLDKTRDFLSAMQRQVRMENRAVTFSLTKEINSMIQMLSYETKKRGVQMNFKFSKGDKFLMYGDLTKFNQIVINLLMNAIDACQSLEGKRKIIDIELRVVDTFFEIIVRDHGEGIDECVIGHIFEPFFTTKKDKGTGVGLTTVKDIIKKDFSGDISVRNNKTLGAEFTIKLKQKTSDKSKSIKKGNKSRG
ncbi:ATP-binding protein [Patescibacteria group bacterium]